jgi:Lrp/AsnC family leucine-responsive transcriptional regulator
MRHDLDSIDLHLLQLLQEDGRASNQAMADEVGLSPSACLRRVRRLEETGVITGYTVLLDPDTTGRGRTVVVELTLTSQREDAMNAFEQAALTVPGLRSCHLLAGEADYLMVLSVEDVDAYEVIHREHLARLPGVARLRTSVALRTVADRAGLPLD